MPTQSKFMFFEGFLIFCPKHQKFIPLGGGGMCILFEICEKRPFRNLWVTGGGVADHIFEYRGQTFRSF